MIKIFSIPFAENTEIVKWNIICLKFGTNLSVDRLLYDLTHGIFFVKNVIFNKNYFGTFVVKTNCVAIIAKNQTHLSKSRERYFPKG